MIKKKKPQVNNEESQNEKYLKHITSYTTVKTSLKSIVKNVKIQEDINDIVQRVNVIITHTYTFIKMYSLYYYEKNESLPDINQKFIVCIMKTLCSFDPRGRKPNEKTSEILKDLQNFYKNHYVDTMNKEDLYLSFTHLSQIIEYEATSILTCLSNHLQNNFYDMFNRYINIKCNKYELEKKATDIETKQLRKEIKVLKMDVLLNVDKCDICYNKIKKDIRENIMKNFDYKSSPVLFLLPSIKMSIDGESIMKNKTKKGDMFSIINCFPLRKNIIPKYIDIDTVSLVFILMEKNKGKYRKDGNILKLKNEILEKVYNYLDTGDQISAISTINTFINITITKIKLLNILY